MPFVSFPTAIPCQVPNSCLLVDDTCLTPECIELAAAIHFLFVSSFGNMICQLVINPLNDTIYQPMLSPWDLIRDLAKSLYKIKISGFTASAWLTRLAYTDWAVDEKMEVSSLCLGSEIGFFLLLSSNNFNQVNKKQEM